MEKLCQAFENGKELVELSQASPHDISNVLKLYLRQVSLGMEAGRVPLLSWASLSQAHFVPRAMSKGPIDPTSPALAEASSDIGAFDLVPATLWGSVT